MTDAEKREEASLESIAHEIATKTFPSNPFSRGQLAGRIVVALQEAERRGAEREREALKDQWERCSKWMSAFGAAHELIGQQIDEAIRDRGTKP